MKKILVAIMFGLMAIAAQAEATFDQVQGLIQQGQYAAAEQGLEVIIKNHPQSAKAFYAMAQAQAGLGNLEKAKKALDIATGLNPALDFAPASSVASLREAITPQVKKIEAVEPSHFWRNLVYVFMFALFAWALYFLYTVYTRKKEDDEGSGYAGPTGGSDPKPTPPSTPSPAATTTTTSTAYTPRPVYRAPVTPPAPAPSVTSTPQKVTGFIAAKLSELTEGKSKIVVAKDDMSDEKIIENIKASYIAIVDALPTKRENANGNQRKGFSYRAA
jgi:hypothetical protein